MKTPELITRQVMELYKNYGAEDYIGETISQLEHMSQAAQLAMNEGYDDEVVLAAFFHDIGQLCKNEPAGTMGTYGMASHEDTGATYLLQQGFSQRIADLVQAHVSAKRYLCYKYPGYTEKLTEASRQTLKYQGGPMNATEALAYEQNPDLDIYLKIRTWDDNAKQTGIPVENLDKLEEKILNHLKNKV